MRKNAVKVKKSDFDGISVDARLTTDDLIAIRLSEFENTCVARRQELESQKKRLQGRLSELQAQLSQAREAEVEKRAAKQVKQFQATGMLEVKVEQRFDIKSSLAYWHIVLCRQGEQASRFGGSCLSLPESSFKFGRAKVNQIEKVEQELKELDQALVELATQVGQMPRLERQVRAELARQKLSNSGGASLVQAIESVKLIGV